MRMDGRKGFAIMLIALGVLIILNKTGFIFGHLFSSIMGIVFPLAVIFLGYLGVKNGRGLIGWILIAIGGVILFVKLSWLIGLIIAIGLIVYGWSMLNKRIV